MWRESVPIQVGDISGKWTVEHPPGHESWACPEVNHLFITSGCRKVGLGGRFESKDDKELRCMREAQAAERVTAMATLKASNKAKRDAEKAAHRAQRDAETSARQAILDRCPCGENPRPARILVSEEVNWIACGGCEQWYHTCCELPSRCNEKVKKNAPAYECNKCRCTRGNHRRDPGRFVEEYCLDCGVYF